MSPGNAHPYSWSAIVNGHFDGEEISRAGYPAVSAYLEANRDTIGLSGAQVTHIWTQDRAVSERIAMATNIATVVEKMEEMIGQVDAVLLARDDPENHKAMAQPFIEADVPIFIDKPLAYSTEDLKWFSEQNAQGKFIMSCSSMRYAGECRTARQELAGLGKLHLVTAVGKKDWKKYGVHLLEGLFGILDDPKASMVRHLGALDKEIVQLQLENGPDVTLHLYNQIGVTFQISLFGEQGWKLVDIRNSYAMFRDNLIEFIRSVEEGNPRLPFEKTAHIMEIIIAAHQSREQGGVAISL